MDVEILAKVSLLYLVTTSERLRLIVVFKGEFFLSNVDKMDENSVNVSSSL